LSIDLDFNYRHMDDRDWGEVRIEVNERIKDVLYRQGYDARACAVCELLMTRAQGLDPILNP